MISKSQSALKTLTLPHAENYANSGFLHRHSSQELALTRVVLRSFGINNKLQISLL